MSSTEQGSGMEGRKHQTIHSVAVAGFRVVVLCGGVFFCVCVCIFLIGL